MNTLKSLVVKFSRVLHQKFKNLSKENHVKAARLKILPAFFPPSLFKIDQIFVCVTLFGRKTSVVFIFECFVNNLF